MSIFLIKSLFIFIFSFLITWYFVPIFSKVAFKFKILDVPDGELKRHKHATPYLGGVVVWFGFLVATSLVLPFENQFFLYILASTILLFVGLLDDLISLTPKQKIFGQFIAVSCYLKAGFYLKINFFDSLWNIGLSAFWFLSVINAFNLIDVMDGLASLVAICTALIFLTFSLILGYFELSLLLLAFIGSLLAFLCFNKPPARMYLGDAGSLFIGGFIASIPFCISWSEYNEMGYLLPAFICSIPLFEVFTLILVRVHKKIPFFYGSPDHFSIFLQERGFSKGFILFLCFFILMIINLISLLFFFNIISLSFFFTCILFFVFSWFLILL